MCIRDRVKAARRVCTQRDPRDVPDGYSLSRLDAVVPAASLQQRFWELSATALRRHTKPDHGSLPGHGEQPLPARQSTQRRYLQERSHFAAEREPVSYTHLRAHETPEHLVCRLLLEKKKKTYKIQVS